MRLLIGLIRAVFIAVGLCIALIFAALLVVVGGAFMLLSGRRPQVRVFRPQDFTAGFRPRPMSYDDFPQPPMKDVTPVANGTLAGSQSDPS